MKDLYQVIDRVRMSEKATMLQENQNEYVFKVARKANKFEIKEAVESQFDVKVMAVRTANCSGKKKNRRRATEGRTAHWKKAYVRLKDGDNLELV